MTSVQTGSKMKKLYVFIYSGLVSVLIDLDHFLVLENRNLPFTLENLNSVAGRPLHIPILIVFFVLFIVSVLKAND